MEFALYSDARMIGELEVGPDTVLNTVPDADGRPGHARQHLVLRHESHLPVEMGLDPEDPKTEVSAFHGAWIDEEIAALLSLALGSRLRSGGIVRAWWDLTSDPLGRPYEGFHQPPYLPAPAGGRSLLPRVVAEVDLGDAQPWLERYRRIKAADANRLVRAARQYQQAIWIADGDPNLAWLMLVSALEAASSGQRLPKRPYLEHLSESWPEMASVLKRAPRTGEEAAKLLADQTRVLRKILRFIERYPPSPPQPRPEWGDYSWVDHVDGFRVICGWRSRALHEGSPFPAPMCLPPTPDESGIPAETGLGGAYGSGASTWKGEDIPMLLHAFAHFVATSLRSWWKSLAA
jgi:hypothetical protein